MNCLIHSFFFIFAILCNFNGEGTGLSSRTLRNHNPLFFQNVKLEFNPSDILSQTNNNVQKDPSNHVFINNPSDQIGQNNPHSQIIQNKANDPNDQGFGKTSSAQLGISGQNGQFGQNGGKSVRYEATWDSLDARPLPTWFDESKVGIFVHWGVFSVPGFASEWFWNQWKRGDARVVEFMKKNYEPNFTYQDFGPMFKAEFYNPVHWADVFKKSGAKYVVLTSKHHEGFTLWPSKYSFSWNAMDVGPKRDVLGELADAVRNGTDLRFGLYHSLYEWYNPLWLSDKASNFTQSEFVNLKTGPELYEIVERYRPEVVWSDGEWEADDVYWKSKEFLAWLYNESPVRNTVVTNDRWGHETLCKHGGYYTCQDRYNPGVLQPKKWENCFTLDKESWGYRRDAKFSDYMTPEELIKTLVETVACGGNVLVNVGPTKEGTLAPIQEERLLQLGSWLEINGQGIYGSVPWKHQNDTLTPGVWFTTKPDEDKVFAFSLNWPEGSELIIETIDGTLIGGITLLGSDEKIEWTNVEGTNGISIKLPNLSLVTSKWAWTFVITTTQQ